jgi:putative acetyltransferase
LAVAAVEAFLDAGGCDNVDLDAGRWMSARYGETAAISGVCRLRGVPSFRCDEPHPMISRRFGRTRAAGVTGVRRAQTIDVSVHVESPDQPDVLKMLAASDAFHASLYPPESNHLLDVAALSGPEMPFLVARAGGRIVGIGSIVCKSQYAEIKRMFVDPGAHGHGIGRRILDALERHARSRGLLCVRLETGTRQLEAIEHYRSAGYGDVGPFGAYRPDPLSLFMEKILSAVASFP